MINGWYCRSVTSDQGYNNMVMKSETSEDETMPARQQPEFLRLRYKNLKKKFKFLIYENEFLSDTLRSSQQKFLKIAQDRSFLLNRLLQYEKPTMSSSESNDDTDSSDEDVPTTKKKKLEGNVAQNTGNYTRQVMPVQVKRKKIVQKKATMSQQQQILIHHPAKTTATTAAALAGQNNVEENVPRATSTTTTTQNIMTTEEVERHLQSRQSLMELLPPETVPVEMFEPCSLDGDDQLIETSPSNLNEDCLSMD